MPTGTISAYSIPDGADVYIDGIAIPAQYGAPARTPTIIPGISAGTHDVTFRLSGYVDEVKTVDVIQGGWTSITAVFHPIKKAVLI